MTREECLLIAGDLLFADGFDHAILGVVQRFNDVFVVYDRTRVVETLMIRDGMSYEEAIEFFDFNIGGAWHGDKTPGFLLRLDD